MRPQLIIFDFDGVVVDSEVAANAILAERLCALGHPTTLEDSLARYMGRRWADCAAMIEGELGRPLPAEFVTECSAAIRARHEDELAAVEGLAAFLDAFAATPRCIASSSRPEWLEWALAKLGLSARFGGRLFSALQVENGKPASDLFLLAAREMGVDPAATLVIEDSVPGVVAGRAAGMTTLGLCAGAHIREGHATRLRAAGAHTVAANYAEAAALISTL